ncbi:hypothetical protein tb265_41880 [Gemmatimonadetes bacterium T265]|nr:hypothetical protein tb265_41880 [Gemmatimonadetes bacterium T265]
MADLPAHLARATGFEWDAGNASKNWTTHTVSQPECEQVFFNVPLVPAGDPAHSTRQARDFCGPCAARVSAARRAPSRRPRRPPPCGPAARAPRPGRARRGAR